MTDQNMPASSDLVDIHVKPAFVREDSEPEEHHFVFSYTVTITNRNHNNIRLLNRAWVITDGNGKVSEVQGKGVVGEQPVIAPGDSYSYTSGCVFTTPVGFMQGHYEMQDIEMDVALNVPIPVFRMARDDILH
ncbi:Co2+/Mg2+ efflux protein ApaG [Oceanospirillum sediminis]|nr:Co2+/Mg2+ efflux protein ApaG [Oceanospirillum sediminis]